MKDTEMDCERGQNLLSEFLDGALTESEQASVNAHLRECLPCRAVKEGLEETLLHLRSLPQGKAPTELLDGVRRRIAREDAPPTPFWKKLFLPAHIKIPLEAAAAILLFLLVYGTWKEELPNLTSPRPAARMDAAPATEFTKMAEHEGSKAPSPPRAQAAEEAVPGDRPVPRENAEPGMTAQNERDSGRSADSAGARAAARVPSLPPASSRSQPSFPVIPAQRVSTAGERIEPPSAAAPPSRVARPVPFGREVTIEVAAQNRHGLEERIAAAAVRLGGSVLDEPAKPGIDSEGEVDIVRVHLPAESARPFLAELSKLGILPAEGMSDRAVLTAGPSLEIVGYTVRIRVR